MRHTEAGEQDDLSGCTVHGLPVRGTWSHRPLRFRGRAHLAGPVVAPSRHHGRRRTIVRALLAAVVVVPALAVGSAASATPRETRDQLEAKLARTSVAAEAASERYLEARSRLDSIKVRVAAAEARSAAQQKAVEAARHEVSLIAAETYRSGDLAALEAFLGDDPDGVLAHSGMMTTLGDRQASAIAGLLSAERRLEVDRSDLLAQRQRAAGTAADAETAKKEAVAKNAVVKAQIARFTTTELARMNASRSGVRDGLRCEDIIIDAPNATARKAIDYACSKIGSPYVWGAVGPNSFDCSGLTRTAYKAAGVSLPRIAADQSHVGTRISVSELRPGDLVFYRSSSRPSHVAIYIGNELRIHAPRQGDHVRIASVRAGQVTAAVRVA